SLALCYFHLGRYEEAAELYRRLEAKRPSRELEVKRRLAERRARHIAKSPAAKTSAETTPAEKTSAAKSSAGHADE
ncbi:MAG: hypothetical protein AAF560_25270, partial [Acidobacteriota bacterium]